MVSVFFGSCCSFFEFYSECWSSSLASPSLPTKPSLSHTKLPSTPVFIGNLRPPYLLNRTKFNILSPLKSRSCAKLCAFFPEYYSHHQHLTIILNLPFSPTHSPFDTRTGIKYRIISVLVCVGKALKSSPNSVIVPCLCQLVFRETQQTRCT